MADPVPPNVAEVIIQRVALIAAGRDTEGKPADYSAKETLDAARLLSRLTKSSNGKSKPGEPWLVESLAEVGTFFDKAERTIKDWRERGMPGEAGGPQVSGRYNLKEIMLWRDANIGPTGRNEGLNAVDESRAEGDRRKSIAEAEIKEMKAATMRGELIEVDTISRDYIHSATHTRALLEQLPHRFQSRLPADTSGDEKRRILTETIKDVDDAMEAVHSCLTARVQETQDTEETEDA